MLIRLKASGLLDRHSIRRAALCVAGSMALAAVLLVASRLTTAPDDAEASLVDLTIPAGAAEAVARGETPISIPAKLQFQPRARIHIQNNDSVPHQLAWLFIPPGGEYTATQAALFPTASRFVCSFHAGGVLAIESASTASSGLSVLWTTLLFGLPLAASVFAVTTIVSKLDGGDRDIMGEGLKP